MLIGYMRVSKSDGSQVLHLQHDALLEAGVELARICEDLGSGRKDDRSGLAACLKALQPGNTLVVWKLDRLGRDLKHLVNTIDALSQCNIGLKVLAGAGAQIDTTTVNGRGVVGIFAALAESAEALLDLRRRLVRETAALFGVSEYTPYRKLRAGGQLHPAHRKDHSMPKVLPEVLAPNPRRDSYC
jgi:DNA invertase Pin-like site-specific DNA recombinase